MKRLLLLTTAMLVAACTTAEPTDVATAPAPPAPIVDPTGAAAVPAKNAELAAFFLEADRAELALSPMAKTRRAIKDADYGRLDQLSDSDAEASRALGLRLVEQLKSRFNRESLSPEDQLSYDLFLYRAAQAELRWPHRKQGYVFEQMYGLQSQLPAFLINMHRVSNVADAEAYISRLSELGRLLGQAIDEAKARQSLGVLPPKWVFPFVIADSQNIISGAPFGPGKDSALWADFKGKVDKLDTDPATKNRLLGSARTALLNAVRPAYRNIIALMQTQQKSAGTDDGIWRFSNGGEYYRDLLKFYTTTDLTPDQIHELGLTQVTRIHEEMSAIKDRVGFDGTLQRFFVHMRDRSESYYPNTAAGKQMYLDESKKAQDMVQAALPRFFGRVPKGELQIKPVEPFREKSAGKAFYDRPAPDGSRPGIYYVNLYDMKDMPATEVEALYCHEGIPGHHLQFAILSELGQDEVPPFRQFGSYTANSEGWGLYAEKLCTEMGLYQDPYRDFGRLQLELHRAMRLVVDSGIHHKRWSRAQAIKYIQDNSADKGIEKAIERYIVLPGQATSYMVGKLKIEELRAKSKAALGARYDDRQFHDTILLAGLLPLDVLEARVDEWIARVRAG